MVFKLFIAALCMESAVNGADLIKETGGMRKFWGAVVSREHVMVGVEGGFAQACHGKQAPLARMKKDDWMVFYSPKTQMGGGETCQKFTGIGKVVGGAPYKFDMGGGFIPFRTDVDFVKTAREASVLPLLPELDFIKNKKNWGAVFRFGHFSIPEEDFRKIAGAMRVDIDADTEALPVRAIAVSSTPTVASYGDPEKKSKKNNKRKLGEEMMVKEFTAEYSEYSKTVKPENIWALWADINNWSRWDEGIESCEFDGEFIDGSSFVLTPKGGGAPVEARLQEVVENKRFSDVAKLPFGTLEFLHEIEKSPVRKGYQVTHRIVAKISEGNADFFERAIWPSMESGLPESVKNLVKLASEN